MRKLCFLPIIFCCYSVVLTAQTPDSTFQLNEEQREYLERDWQRYYALEGEFTVMVPGQMREKVDTVNTPLGQLTYHTFFFRDPMPYAENYVYMVSYVDYPKETLHSDSLSLLDDFFAATLEEAAFSIQGEVIYKTIIEQQGYPGLLWRMQYLDGKGVIKTKAIVRENRYYSIQAVTSKELGLNLATDRFLDSFKLVLPSK